MVNHLDRHLVSGHRSPGVVIARVSQSMRMLVECLVLIAHAGQPDDFAEVATYIP
jgi:hypothetical protein